MNCPVCEEELPVMIYLVTHLSSQPFQNIDSTVEVDKY